MAVGGWEPFRSELARASERRPGFERTMPVNHGLFPIRNPEEDFCSLAQPDWNEGQRTIHNC